MDSGFAPWRVKKEVKVEAEEKKVLNVPRSAFDKPLRSADLTHLDLD